MCSGSAGVATDGIGHHRAMVGTRERLWRKTKAQHINHATDLYRIRDTESHHGLLGGAENFRAEAQHGNLPEREALYPSSLSWSRSSRHTGVPRKDTVWRLRLSQRYSAALD